MFLISPCSVWRIIDQQREGELWPRVTSTGVQEIPSVSPAGTMSGLPLRWAAFSERSLPWAGCHTWCCAKIPSSLHYSVHLCRDTVITGCHRQELSVSRDRSVFILSYFCVSSGESYKVLIFPQYIISTANISHHKHHHLHNLKMEKIRHLWRYLICFPSSWLTTLALAYKLYKSESLTSDWGVAQTAGFTEAAQAETASWMDETTYKESWSHLVTLKGSQA